MQSLFKVNGVRILGRSNRLEGGSCYNVTHTMVDWA